MYFSKVHMGTRLTGVQHWVGPTRLLPGDVTSKVQAPSLRAAMVFSTRLPDPQDFAGFVSHESSSFMIGASGHHSLLLVSNARFIRTHRIRRHD